MACDASYCAYTDVLFLTQIVKTHPWLQNDYEEAWPIKCLIQSVLANIKLQDRRSGTSFIQSNVAMLGLLYLAFCNREAQGR